jgi:hypothetical protein
VTKLPRIGAAIGFLLAGAIAVLPGAPAWAGDEAPAPSEAPASPEAPATPPGEGVLCVWALLTVAAEVGRRCHPGEEVEFQEELAASLASIEAFVVANSDPPPTPEEIARFKHDQGRVGAPLALVCTDNAEQLYRGILGVGAAELHTHVELMLARPGPPTWGTCL